MVDGMVFVTMLAHCAVQSVVVPLPSSLCHQPLPSTHTHLPAALGRTPVSCKRPAQQSTSGASLPCASASPYSLHLPPSCLGRESPLKGSPTLALLDGLLLLPCTLQGSSAHLSRPARGALLCDALQLQHRGSCFFYPMELGRTRSDS